MNYRIDFDIKFLWMFKTEINLFCISEIKVKSIFYNVHDQDDHWEKNEIITKFRNIVYWLNQTENVIRYIAEYMKCVRHESVIRIQFFHSINVIHSFQLIKMNYIDSLAITTNENFHILHIMNYFIRFFFLFTSVISLNQKMFCAAWKFFF